MKQHCEKLISSLKTKRSLLARPSGRGKATLQCSSRGITIRVTLECITQSDFVGTLQLNTYAPYWAQNTAVNWEFSTFVSATNYDSLWSRLMDTAEHALLELALSSELG
jgi:hypothetical protein